MAVDLRTVMDGIGAALGTVTGLRVFDFPPDSAEPPFAFVGMPDTITYDATYGRGVDRMSLRVHVGVGTQVDRETRDVLADYAAGGLGSVKNAIESITDFDAQVTTAEFGVIQLAGQTYPGLSFTVDVAA